MSKSEEEYNIIEKKHKKKREKEGRENEFVFF